MALLGTEIRMAELSKTMQGAKDYAKEHGALCRYPGGYWQKPGIFDRWASHYSTPTVEALVKRGVAEYTEWRDGKNGRFPVRCELVPNGPLHGRRRVSDAVPWKRLLSDSLSFKKEFM